MKFHFSFNADHKEIFIKELLTVKSVKLFLNSARTFDIRGDVFISPKYFKIKKFEWQKYME